MRTPGKGAKFSTPTKNQKNYIIACLKFQIYIFKVHNDSGWWMIRTFTNNERYCLSLPL